MSFLEQQLLESWQIHNRITLFMIEQIPGEALKATLSKRGGRDIARQLAHVQNVRVWRLESFRKKLGVNLIEFEKDKSPNKEKLVEAFRQSGAVMEKYIEHCLANGSVVSNFKRGVIPMVCYYLP